MSNRLMVTCMRGANVPMRHGVEDLIEVLVAADAALQNDRGEGGASGALRGSVVAPAFLDRPWAPSLLPGPVHSAKAPEQTWNCSWLSSSESESVKKSTWNLKTCSGMRAAGSHQLASARLAVICCALVPLVSIASFTVIVSMVDAGSKCDYGDEPPVVEIVLRHRGAVAAHAETHRCRSAIERVQGPQAGHKVLQKALHASPEFWAVVSRRPRSRPCCRAARQMTLTRRLTGPDR